jgi:hypothetical protein
MAAAAGSINRSIVRGDRLSFIGHEPHFFSLFFLDIFFALLCLFDIRHQPRVELREIATVKQSSLMVTELC